MGCDIHFNNDKEFESRVKVGEDRIQELEKKVRDIMKVARYDDYKELQNVSKYNKLIQLEHEYLRGFNDARRILGYRS